MRKWCQTIKLICRHFSSWKDNLECKVSFTLGFIHYFCISYILPSIRQSDLVSSCIHLVQNLIKILYLSTIIMWSKLQRQQPQYKSNQKIPLCLQGKYSIKIETSIHTICQDFFWLESTTVVNTFCLYQVSLSGPYVVYCCLSQMI